MTNTAEKAVNALKARPDVTLKENYKEEKDLI